MPPPCWNPAACPELSVRVVPLGQNPARGLPRGAAERHHEPTFFIDGSVLMNPFLSSTVALPGRSGWPRILRAAGLAALTWTGAAGAVDLNTATLDQLRGVRGIGPKTAQIILQERERGGRLCDAVCRCPDGRRPIREMAAAEPMTGARHAHGS